MSEAEAAAAIAAFVTNHTVEQRSNYVFCDQPPRLTWISRSTVSTNVPDVMSLATSGLLQTDRTAPQCECDNHMHHLNALNQRRSGVLPDCHRVRRPASVSSSFSSFVTKWGSRISREWFNLESPKSPNFTEPSQSSGLQTDRMWGHYKFRPEAIDVRKWAENDASDGSNLES